MDNPVSVKNLRVYVDEFFEKLELFDDYDNRHDYKGILKACIDVFLDNETNYTAKDVYRTFFMIYQITEEDKSSRQEKENLVSQSNTLLNLVEVMEKYEENTGELIDRQRDHFIHSVNVFLLGLAIYSQNSKYRKIFRRYVRNSGYDDYYRKPDSDEMSDEEFLYRWGVAALLHDIGYPFEIIGKQLKKIINDSLKTISNSYNIGLGIDFDDFDEFNSIVKIDPYNFADDYRIKYNESKILDMYKPTHILAHKLSRDFDFDNDESEKLRKHLDLFVDYMRRNDFIDHGFFSAIMVLNSYGKIFQKFEKNTVYFFYPVVDSASAILLHNYYNKTLQKDPFNLGLLSPNTNPIAYLLILCDELQEWNRQPFGVVDKQKVHVTQLAMEIKSNKYLDVVYILNKGSVGLGFSKDKRKLIESILDVNAIFEKGIFVSSDVKPEVQEEIMRNMDIGDIQAPDILIRNIESLAERINSYYNETIQAQYDEKIAKGEEIDENLRKSIEYMETDFKNLEPEFKLSNLRQARSIPKKLDMIGCEIASINDERKALTANDFDDKEILNLAIFEHQEWKREKEGNGWTYAEIKDRKKRETPYLVDWDELKEESQELDRQTVLIIPELLESIGLKVVRTKIRLLTYKMQQYFENEFHPLASDNYSEKKYRELPDHVQYANFKQARFIVEILNEKGYDLVDVEDRGVPIRKFGDEDLEHFAKREHYGWCALKHDLGWVYASTYDDVGMTSPNLVDWDELKDDLQENNLNTFKNLPKMCDEVGLKIVKSA